MRSGGPRPPVMGSECEEEESEWRRERGERRRGAFWHDHEDVEVELLDNEASEDSIVTPTGDKSSRQTNGNN